MNGFGKRTPARSMSAWRRRNARTSSCDARNWPIASASDGACRGWILGCAFLFSPRLHRRLERSHEPATDQSRLCRPTAPSALRQCTLGCWLHRAQIHAIRDGQMVEAFRNTPRLGLEAPGTDRPGEATHKRACIPFSGVEARLPARRYLFCNSLAAYFHTLGYGNPCCQYPTVWRESSPWDAKAAARNDSANQH